MSSTGNYAEEDWDPYQLGSSQPGFVSGAGFPPNGYIAPITNANFQYACPGNGEFVNDQFNSFNGVAPFGYFYPYPYPFSHNGSDGFGRGNGFWIVLLILLLIGAGFFFFKNHISGITTRD